MLKFLASTFLMFFAFPVIAQEPLLNWAKAFTNSTDNRYYRDLSNGRTIATDKDGNVYSAGLFQYSIDLDPGPDIHSITATNNSETGIYISKLDANGNFVWGVQLSVLTEFGTIEMKTDDKGNVYLASSFIEAVDFDPGPGVLMMSPIGSRDAFVIKLDTNGKLVWAKQFGGPGDTVPEATAVEVDKNDNVIICGQFNNTVDFDPGPEVFNLTSTAHLQSFIAKLTGNGDFVWALQFGNAPVVYSGSSILDVRCDNVGNIYTTGTFTGDCDFDPGATEYRMHTSSFFEAFISKLDSKGNFIWAKQIANPTDNYYSYSRSLGIDVDVAGNVITTGVFTGDFDFDPGPAVLHLSEYAIGPGQAYIQKLNNNGDLVWAEQIGSNEGSNGNDVAIDAEGSIYMIGDFSKATDFDPGPGKYIVNSDYNYFAGLVKLDANGSFVYALPFASNCLLRRMDVDLLQNICITGYFAGTIDFDPGPGVYTLESTMDESPYVLKLSRCIHATTADLYIDTCRSYTMNNKTFDSSGIYQQIISNSYGCDSLITLHLSVNKQIKEQMADICEGDSFFAGGINQITAGIYSDTLQTVNGCDSIITTHLTVHPKPLPDLGNDRSLCSNTQAIITPGNFADYSWQDGSNRSNFTVSNVGTYWVKVTNEFSCTTADTLNITSILPSPSQFLKTTDSICNSESLLITPLHAYTNYQWSTGAQSNSISVQNPGTYWLKVTDDNKCSGYDTISIIQKQCERGIYIPSAFSPNGDGKNDFFKPQVYGNIIKYHFVVYNRWGKIVFETKDPNKGWNGYVNGLPQTIGNFVWMCNYQLEGLVEEHRNGFVVLLR